MTPQQPALPPSTDPSCFPVFGAMDKKTYIVRKANLLLPLYNFAVKELSYDWGSIAFSQNVVSRIVDMVQRREVYFHVYHNLKMGELNEACLNCFWIIKFQPFRHVQDPSDNINITLALAMFTRAITYTAKKNGIKPNFTKEAVEHLKHAFTYRDLSKEALMAIAKSLAG